MERILPQLRAYARSLVANVDDADDLVSKTCVRILEKREQFNPGRPLIAWAIRILKNLNIDEFRKQKNMIGSVDPDLADVSSNPGPVIDIGRLIHQLPVEQREVMVLSGIGYRYKEIAEYLSIPIGTVMSRLKRGRDALHGLMDCGGKAI